MGVVGQPAAADLADPPLGLFFLDDLPITSIVFLGFAIGLFILGGIALTIIGIILLVRRNRRK
jgi:hypothetical protein